MPLWSTKSTAADPLPKYLSKSDFGTFRAQDCFAGKAGFYHIPEKFNKAGTGSIAVSGTTVTGTSTKFLTEATVGQWLTSTPVTNNTDWANKTLIGKIASIASDTSITLASTAATYSAGTKFSIIQNVQPELLVAINGLLPDKIGAARIVALEWQQKKSITAASTGGIYVHFDEPVKFSGTPTMVLSGAVTATFASFDTTGSRALFTFTAPAAGTSITVATQSLGGTGNVVDLLGTSPATTAATSVSIPASVAAKLRAIVTV